MREYYEALHAHGVRGFAWEECWDGLPPPVLPRDPDDGRARDARRAHRARRRDVHDERSPATPSRSSTSTRSSCCPSRAAGGRRRCARQPADEGRHAPGPEELWNESWYFDAVSADGSLGVYARLGLYPNLGVSWVTAFVCGPGRPTVAVIDFAAPLPEGDELAVARGDLRAEHICEAALERFRVRLEATGEAHDDAAALLRGEAGAPDPGRASTSCGRRSATPTPTASPPATRSRAA